MKFIELKTIETQHGEARPFLVNIAHIKRVWPDGSGIHTYLSLVGEQENRHVANDYESIKNMLKAHQAL